MSPFAQKNSSMPKMKTNRGTAKRMKRSASGSFRHARAYHRHLLTHKSSSKKRAQREKSSVSTGDRARLKRLLPYA